MGSLLRSAVAVGLAAGLGLPASAQGQRCTHDVLTIDGIAVVARFCIPADAAAPSVSVAESFTAQGKAIERTTSLPIVAGALISRTIDDVDLGSIGPKHTLHMTLAFSSGAVVLEHALALPGAIPVK